LSFSDQISFIGLPLGHVRKGHANVFKSIILSFKWTSLILSIIFVQNLIYFVNYIKTRALHAWWYFFTEKKLWKKVRSHANDKWHPRGYGGRHKRNFLLVSRIVWIDPKIVKLDQKKKSRNKKTDSESKKARKSRKRRTFRDSNIKVEKWSVGQKSLKGRTKHDRQTKTGSGE